MRFEKKIRIALIIFIIVMGCISIINYCIRMKEKEDYKYTYLWTTIEKLNNNELIANDIDSIGIIETIDILFYDEIINCR